MTQSSPPIRRWSLAALPTALTALLATGCDERAAPSATIEIDSAGVRIVAIDPFASDALCSLSEEPTFYVGDSEDSDEQWFTRVLGVARLSDGSVAVADDYSMEVRIFDPSGAHVRSMGREGEGPGEFKRLWQMWRLPGDTLWVGDYRPWRYHVYAPSTGEWIRTVTMDPVYPNPSRAGGGLANGVSINPWDERAKRRDFRTPDTRHVEAHAPDGRLTGTVASLPGRVMGQVDDGAPNYYMGVWYEASPSIDAEARTIVTANGRDPEVRVLDDEMRLRLIIRWDDPGREVTSAHVQAAREAERRRALENHGEIGPFEEANLSPQRPAADVFPAVSSVKAGMDGSVWVYRYRKPGETGPRLMGFDPEGDFVCHLVSGKSGFSIREFGADYVLGVHTNELGVQHVAMYDLERPGGPPE